MKILAIALVGLMLATTASGCIFLAKPAYEKAKELVADDDDKDEKK